MMPISVDDAVVRMQKEYAELPGLKLTPWQAQRLWNLPDDLCQRALRVLIDARVLARTVDGSYVRRTPSPAADSGWAQPGAQGS